MYVDDLNFIETPEELTITAKYLKKEFEMKDLLENKILSRSADRAFSYWSFSSSIDIYYEIFKTFLYG